MKLPTMPMSMAAWESWDRTQILLYTTGELFFRSCYFYFIGVFFQFFSNFSNSNFTVNYVYRLILTHKL